MKVPDDIPPWEACPVAEVTEDEYLEYLEMLPPRIIGGKYFLFAEGEGDALLFWRARGRFFKRQLTAMETARLIEP
jgi:hypothetical protein